MLDQITLDEHASLHHIERALASLVADGSETTVQHNLGLIATLGRPDRLVPLLREVLGDAEALSTVAGRSYRHVNYFDKIVLVDTDNTVGYRLTLHLWEPPYTPEELANNELIHDHRFSFWSTVLTGDLTSENFTRSEGGAIFREYRYVPEKRHLSTMANFYEFVGETKLLKAGQGWSVKKPGQSYYLFNEGIHRVLLPHTEMTCTLVLRGPRRRAHANVFNTSYPRQNVHMTNVMFTPPELALKLSRLAATVERTRLSAGGDTAHSPGGGRL